ncbi:MAG: DEAD/DEAH box family ATP-dependent RNA helicase [Steroidobacteraceae bacterium]
MTSFSDLGLAPGLLRAVADKGYDTPTLIQARAIPALLDGRDVLASAQTGTGKTAGFVLPLLQKLGAPKGRAPRALVLTPTRELAAQVAQCAREYGRHTGLRMQVIFGGVGEKPQIDGLRAGCDLLVATPGRLLDLEGQGALDLGEVAHFVLDEADRMLDMGFIHAIKRVIRLLPAQRQNAMFSATYSDDIRALAARLLHDPVAIDVAPRNTVAERIEHVAFKLPKEHKRHLLAHLIKDGAWPQVLVFTRTKHGANRLAEQLDGAGIRAAAIHGNKSQSARVRALEDFKAHRITALVATDVASRGLDIKELPHVVNYELPNVPEDYVHRIGRTARAGATGHAVSLVAPDEAGLLRDIEKVLKRAVPYAAAPAFEISAAPPPRREAPAPQHSAHSARAAHPERAAHPGRAAHRGGAAQPPRRGGPARRHGGGGRAGAARRPGSAGRFSGGRKH